MGFEDVLWLGGGCGAGKSTVARRLAYRFDLRLYRVDSFAYPHQGRIDAERHSTMDRLSRLSYAEMFVDTTVEEMVADFRDSAAEQFEMIVSDVEERRGGPLVIAEGPALFPELVAPWLAAPSHGLWLLPTPEFGALGRTRRVDIKPVAGSAAEVARRHLIERDAWLTEVMRGQAEGLGLNTMVVDGSLDLGQTEAAVAKYFEGVLEGRRRATGAERAAMRRAENAESHRAVTMFLDSLGDKAPEDPPPVDFACECETLGCGASVSLSPRRYRSPVLAH